MRLVTLERWHKEQKGRGAPWAQQEYGYSDPAWEAIMGQLTDDELEAIISTCEKVGGHGERFCDTGWVDANLTVFEVRAIQRVADLAKKAGVLWGTL